MRSGDGMTATPQRAPQSQHRSALRGFVAGMVGLSFAAVPLYQLFCQVTGYGGTTQRAEAVAGPVLERLMTVRFDANVGPGLSWDFQPVERQITLKVGEQGEMVYRATNRSNRPRPAPRCSMSARTCPAPISPRSNASASPSRRCSRARASTCR
jgi:cytochrome c oxidase assembly protein subunit 11